MKNNGKILQDLFLFSREVSETGSKINQDKSNFFFIQSMLESMMKSLVRNNSVKGYFALFNSLIEYFNLDSCGWLSLEEGNYIFRKINLSHQNDWKKFILNEQDEASFIPTLIGFYQQTLQNPSHKSVDFDKNENLFLYNSILPENPKGLFHGKIGLIPFLTENIQRGIIIFQWNPENYNEISISDDQYKLLGFLQKLSLAHDFVMQDHQMMRTLIEYMPIPVFYKDMEGKYLGCNELFARDVIGKPVEELIGKTVFDLCEPEYANVYHQKDQELLTKMELNVYETEVLYADNTPRTIQFHKSFFLGNDNEFIGIIGAMLDVTSLRNSEKELRNSQEAYLTLARNIPDSVAILLDEDWKVILAEGAGMEIFFSSHQLHDGCPKSLLGEELWSIIKPFIYRSFNGCKGTFETSMDEKEFHITISPVKQETDKIIGCIILIQEITLFKHSQAVLAQMEKLSSIGQLAGGIAHDFNNILTAIIGYAHLAEDLMGTENYDSEKVILYMKNILKASHRAQDLTTQILNFARKEEPIMEKLIVYNIASEVIEIIAKPFRFEGYNIELNGNRNLMIEGDSGQIHQVIQNLIFNARDSMPRGGNIEVSIDKVHLDKEFDGCMKVPSGNYCIVKVKDEGCGIPEDVSKKIFDPFYTTKNPGKGTGMGLSVVYGNVLNHNGYIHFTTSESENSGTEFQLFFPLTYEDEYIDDSEILESYNVEKCCAKILLVDDEFMLRDFIQELLSNIGYEVFSASDGEQAKELFSQNNFDIVVTDLIMSPGNGRELFDYIREINSDFPIIVMTGYSEEDHINYLINNGVNSIIQKPFAMNDLFQAIRKGLEQKK